MGSHAYNQDQEQGTMGRGLWKASAILVMLGAAFLVQWFRT